MKITLDFETRSEADLFKVGAWAYSMDPTTEVLCIGWDDGQWKMGEPVPYGLFDDVLMADEIEAHSAFFEMSIWENVCVRRYGWVPVLFEQWRCTAARAAAMSLPRSLGDAGRALKLKILKDEETGKWAMMRLSKPQKPTAKNPDMWNNDPELWAKMLQYNRNDVAAEKELSGHMRELSPLELRTWQMTERMNLRGFAVDVEGVKKAIRLAGAHAKTLTAEFNKITGLDTAGQRAKFMAWLAKDGIVVANTTAATLDAMLSVGLMPGSDHRRAVEIVRELGRSSIKKYRAMLDMQVGGRIRGSFLYCGAAATGRWAGRGVQPQNFPRAAVIHSQDTAWDTIHMNDLESLQMMAPPIEALSGALRGAIWAPPGRRLLAGDFSQIEARGVSWLGGDKKTLAVFESGEDVYLDMASTIFGRRVTKDEKDKRFLGKQATLALGFGAGFVKFLIHCRNLGAPPFKWSQVCELVPAAQREAIWRWLNTDGFEMVKRLIPKPTRSDLQELVLTKYIVDRYRAARKDTVVKAWNDYETAFRMAMGMVDDKEWIRTGRVAWRRDHQFILCKLPSGRMIYYPYPEFKGRELTYMGQDDGQWRRTKTYGGKLMENVTQALARDVMAEAMLRLEATPPYHELVMSVHDEAVVEIDDGVGTLDEFLKIMAEVPAWASGLPIAVEGFEARRYRK